ncbi:hypothetical protein LLG96_03005 [bacterium]|nr:hypothetical protein [bacterium]
MKKTYVFMITAAVLICLYLFGCGKEQKPVVTPSSPASLADVVQQGKSDMFAVAFDRYRQGDTKDLPIGVFDSGIGGLTVLSEILKLDRFNNTTHQAGADGRPDFESERFVYLGDQANMPYGNYPSENRVDFLKELIIKDAVFLLGQRYWPSGEASAPKHDKQPVKAIVIACNTATAYGLEDVRAALASWNLPVYLVGVVEAGARGAVETIKDRQSPGAVAVMATVGTCQSEGYVRAVEKSSAGQGLKPPGVIQQGSLGLAGAIEGDPSFIVPGSKQPRSEYRGPAVGNPAAPIDTTIIGRYGFDMTGITGDTGDPAAWQINSIENYIRYDTTSLVENYRRSGATEPITTVILGCTHFPFRVKAIEASFDRLRAYRTPDGTQPYGKLIAGHISFIDPSQLTASQLYEALAASGLLLMNGDSVAIPADEFYISVPNRSLDGVQLTESGGFDYAWKYGRTPGRLDVEYVKRVPMSRENLSPEVRRSIRETMPVVWDRLIVFNATSPRCSGLPEQARITPGE